MLRSGHAQYKVIRKIGGGGLGTVDEIEITHSNNSLAVGSHWACKRLNTAWKNHPEARARFEREIQALKNMSHSGIISYQAENTADSNERCYVMPLYPSTVRHLIAGNPGGIAWNWVANFGATVADAMLYAHQCGYKHREQRLNYKSCVSPTDKTAQRRRLTHATHKPDEGIPSDHIDSGIAER